MTPLMGWYFPRRTHEPGGICYYTIVDFIDGKQRLYKGDVTLYQVKRRYLKVFFLNFGFQVAVDCNACIQFRNRPEE